MSPPACDVSSNVVAIVPGPDSKGIARGKTEMSAPTEPCSVGSGACNPPREPNNIGIAATKRSIPPLMEKAWTVTPRYESTARPAIRKKSATPSAMSTARINIARRRIGDSSLVRATKMGTTPGGSTTTSRVTNAASPNLTKSWSTM
jgi:hypothetical protein